MLCNPTPIVLIVIYLKIPLHNQLYSPKRFATKATGFEWLFLYYRSCELHNHQPTPTQKADKHPINMTSRNTKKDKTYFPSLRRLMEHKDGRTYPSNHTFENEALLSITPAHLCAWFSELAYGTPTPGADDKPTKCRSTTLLGHKKMISHFHPRKDVQWDSIRGEGNPTRSQAVNALISAIKVHEVRRQGVPSQARRPFSYDEFLKLLAVADAITNNEAKSCRFRAMCTLQWQLIGRVDDMQKVQVSIFVLRACFCMFSLTMFGFACLTLLFQVSNIGFDEDAPQGIVVQLSWSKNIREERSPPSQIVFGSGDEHLCTLIHLATHLESSMDPAVTTEDSFVYGMGVNLDNQSRFIIKRAIELGEFAHTPEGRLGTHSICKGAGTYCARLGASKNDIERRGRWRNTKQVDTYISIHLPVPDAIISTKLSGPKGAVSYKVKEEVSGVVTNAFILSDVVPSIAQIFGPGVGLVLGRALLWAAVSFKERVPAALLSRVMTALQRATGDVEINPIERVPIVATGPGGRLHIVEVGGGRSGESDEERIQIGYEATNSAALLSSIVSLTRRVEELAGSLTGSMTANHDVLMRRMDVVDRGVQRIAVQPVVRSVVRQGGEAGRGGTVGGGGNGAVVGPRLSKRPKDLYILWAEYEHGTGGSKAAKAYTRKERGANKHALCRRIVFWRMVSSLVARGHTSDLAIDKIYGVYGRRLGVTEILRRMKADEKERGGHPELRG